MSDKTYRVWFQPGPEWFAAKADMTMWVESSDGRGKWVPAAPKPEHYPLVSKRGLTADEAEAFVAANAWGHPEYYRVEAEDEPA